MFVFERVFRKALKLMSMTVLAVPFVAAAASVDIEHEMKRAKEAVPAEAVADSVKNKEQPKVLELRSTWRPQAPAGRAGALSEEANNSPGSAQYLDLNTQWSDTLAAQGEQDWYYVYVPGNGKVTAFLSTVNNASLDYDLYVYKYNPVDGTLADAAQSFYGPAHYEQASVTAASGDYYFIMVHAYQGADAVNPYTLAVLHSSAPDVAEPDDNPWQGSLSSPSINVTHTLDNGFDEDWTTFHVAQENAYTFSLSTGAAGSYQLHLFGANPNGAPLAIVSKNSARTYTLPPGTWHVRVLSLDTVDPNASYALRVGVSAASMTLDRVDTDSGNGGYLNYGYGYAWRVYRSATFVGKLRDRYGNVVPNAVIELTVNTPDTYVKETRAIGESDANGSFSISVSLPAAAGRHRYDNWSSIHYYDLASVVVASGGMVSSKGLYHFAYSVYQPH